MGGWSTVALRTRGELMILTKESPLTAVVIVVVVVVDAVAASSVVIAAAGSAGAGAAAVVVGLPLPLWADFTAAEGNSKERNGEGETPVGICTPLTKASGAAVPRPIPCCLAEAEAEAEARQAPSSTCSDGTATRTASLPARTVTLVLSAACPFLHSVTADAVVLFAGVGLSDGDAWSLRLRGPDDDAAVLPLFLPLAAVVAVVGLGDGDALRLRGPDDDSADLPLPRPRPRPRPRPLPRPCPRPLAAAGRGLTSAAAS